MVWVFCAYPVRCTGFPALSSPSGGPRGAADIIACDRMEGQRWVWGFWVIKLLARDSRLASLCLVYSLKARPDHLPSVLIPSSDIPVAAALCARSEERR